MNVWIFQSGEPLSIDGPNARHMRAMNLTNALLDAGHKVILWSTDFYHQEKRFRFGKTTYIKVKSDFEVRLIHSRGYKKNIGVERIIDHVQLAYNLKKKLQTETILPDIVFIGYPPIETAYVLSKYLNKFSIPYVLDVKDQWPTLFVDALPRNLKILGRIVFLPYYIMARKIMLSATGISSMSNSFLSWVYAFSGRKHTQNDDVFPLAPPDFKIDNDKLFSAKEWWKTYGIVNDNFPKFCFIGSLSQAFDFLPIKEAAELFIKNDINLKIIICGEGGDSEKITSLFAGLPNIIFAGWIDRPKIEILSSLCAASLAPYKNTDNFTANIPNKILDSLSLGLPIISPLNGEVKNLILEYNVGMSYHEKSGNELFNCMSKLIQSPDLYRVMSKNAKQLYEKEFNYTSVYERLVSHLVKLQVK